MELHQPSITSTVEAIVNFLIWPSITTTTMILLSSFTTSMYSNHHSLSSALTSFISAPLTVPLPVNILVVVDIPVESRVSHLLVADRALRATLPLLRTFYLSEFHPLLHSRGCRAVFQFSETENFNPKFLQQSAPTSSICHGHYARTVMILSENSLSSSSSSLCSTTLH